MASRKGNQVRFQRGMRNFSRKKDKKTTLISMKRKRELLEAHLPRRGDPSIQDKNVKTSFNLTSESGYVRVVKVLIKGKGKLTMGGNNGITALFLESDDGYIKVFKALMEGRGDPNTQNNDGQTALMLAAGNAYVKVTEALLEEGGNPNIQNNDEKTALIVASEKGYEDVVVALLKKGSDPDIQDNNGKTALIVASEMGYEDVVVALLEKGSDPDIQDNNGKTALIVASEMGYEDVVVALLEKGSDPNIQDNNGKTALMFITEKKTYGFQFRFAAIESDLRNRTYRSIFRTRPLDILRALLEKGADPNKQDSTGMTALMMSSQADCADAVRALLNGGADPNKQDDKEMTALMYAVGGACHELLLDHGADPNLLDKLRRTVFVHRLQFLTDTQCFMFYDRSDQARSPISILMNRGASPIVHISHRHLLHEKLTGILDFLSFQQTVQILVMNGLLMHINMSQGWSERGEYPPHGARRTLGWRLGRIFQPTQNPRNANRKSPLHWAMDMDDIEAVKYMLACCYITEADLKLFFGIVTSHQTQSVSHRFTSDEGDVKVVAFLQQAIKQPWSLSILAFIAVSSALGGGPQRENRVRQTGLPPKLQRKLMFQTPIAELPISQWSEIEFFFDPAQ